MVRMSEEVESHLSNVKRVVKGSLVAIVMSIILLIIFSILLTYTRLGENTIPIVTLAITGISILVGSGIAGSRIKKNGLLMGMAVGAIYILSIYLLSSIISGNFGMSLFSMIMILVSIATGAIRRNNWGK